MAKINQTRLFKGLDTFHIELPSWGFADTGTRFGKFFQAEAASTLEEKLADAGLCHRLTGACPTVALHTLWDFEPGQDPKQVAKLAKKQGISIGAINPNVFQDQAYKLGSLASPDIKTQKKALAHHFDSIALAKAVGSKAISLWYADGTNYPGQDNIRNRKHAFEKGLKKVHAKLPAGMAMWVEYKPFEPSFYHTDIADWGMAYLFAKKAGPRAKVLVDTGHHLQGTNIEHIVAILLDENMLGGFHFNDRKYADDDLTLGSIDPYAIFRIFNIIAQHEYDTGKVVRPAYMVDQCHNLKSKIEAILQTVDMAQKQFLKAQLVDRKALAKAQNKGDVLGAESLLVDAYDTDVRPVLAAWRRKQGLPGNPITHYRQKGYAKLLAKQRAAARQARGEVQSSSFA